MAHSTLSNMETVVAIVHLDAVIFAKTFHRVPKVPVETAQMSISKYFKMIRKADRGDYILRLTWEKSKDTFVPVGGMFELEGKCYVVERGDGCNK